jgi:hypothetical protein
MLLVVVHEILGKREWTFDDGCDGWNKSAAMFIVAVWRTLPFGVRTCSKGIESRDTEGFQW